MSDAYIPEHHTADRKLGQGAYRVVYEYDEQSVVKMDTWTPYYGNSACIRELEVWERIKHSPDRRHFAAILEYTDGDSPWLRMERVVKLLADELWESVGEPPQSNRMPDPPQEFAHLGYYSWYEELPFIKPVIQAAHRNGIGDLHPWNIGQRADGSWCVIDYAQ